MQSVCASSWNECEKNLKDIKSDISQFFSSFEKEHNLSRDELRAILEICESVQDAFVKVSSKQNQRDVEFEYSKFLKSFFEKHMQVNQLLTQFTYRCSLMKFMADIFGCEKKTSVCNSNDKVCSCSCEAETNKLGCDLQKFFDEISSDAATVKKTLAAIQDFCDRMYDLALKLYCKILRRDGDADCTCGDGKNLSSAIKSFTSEFGKLLNDISALFSKVGEICDRLSKEIENWSQRVSKN